MARPHIVITTASVADAGHVAGLWVASALAGGTSNDLAARAVGGTRVADALSRHGTAVLLASLDGRPVGFAVLTTRTQGLLDPEVLAIDELFVLPDVRRQGVARHLMAAVARRAESEGHAMVLAHVPAADKAGSRFFARLGFSVSVSRRVVPTSVLRRKLASPEHSSRDVLIGRRRTIRARIGSGDADTGPIPTRPIAVRRTVG